MPLSLKSAALNQICDLRCRSNFDFRRCFSYFFWTVSALVVVINGYLLMGFFVSEIKGFLFEFLLWWWQRGIHMQVIKFMEETLEIQEYRAMGHAKSIAFGYHNSMCIQHRVVHEYQ